MSGLATVRAMNRLTIQRMAALLTLLAIGAHLWVTRLQEGQWIISPVRDGIEILLVVWLFNGSSIARWIVAALSSLAVVMAVAFAAYFSFASQFQVITLDLSTVIIAGTVVLYAVVAFLLMGHPSFKNRARGG